MVHFKHYKSRRGMWLVASSFYATYSKMFSDDFIFNAEFIDHESPEIGRKYPTHNDKFDRADGLLRHYAAAKCVVTSRIHCALPCLSLGTPVIYVASENQGTVSSCRLKGIYELLNVMRLHSDGTLKSDFKIDGKINIDNFPSNKNKYKMLQQQLVRLCRRFVQK